MKKLVTGVLTLSLLVSLSTTTAFAAGPGGGRCAGLRAGRGCLYTGALRSFTDADGDGVCDFRALCGGNGNGAGFVDADADGVCDNYAGGGKGNGAGFVDADADGVCDNYAGGGNGNGAGYCGGNGNGNGGHCGGQRRCGR